MLRADRHAQPRPTPAAPLAAEDVEQLPEGTPVRIIWNGGNGPHRYIIAVDEHGRRYAAANDDPGDRRRWYNPLSSAGPLNTVGTERHHTRVWLDP